MAESIKFISEKKEKKRKENPLFSVHHPLGVKLIACLRPELSHIWMKI